VAACASDLGARAVALGADPARVSTLLHGVDAADLAGGDEVDWRARAGAAPGDLFVAALGRLVAKKGFTYLLRATAKLAAGGVPIRVAIGGTGDLAAALGAEASALGIGDRVRLLGDVPHDQVGGLFRAADVVAVPSVRDENGNVDGLPNVLLEAMAVGRPVVSSRIAGVPDVVDPDRNGLLVPPADDAALAEALARLHADPRMRARLGEGASATARALSWTAYGDHLIAGYERAIAERREP
jgi:glycosyltransferase involved in cell wall biosynthesis